MREIRTSGSEGGARFKPWSLPLSAPFSLHCYTSKSSRAEKIFPTGRSADLQSALGVRRRKADCKSALRFGCGFAALCLCG